MKIWYHTNGTVKSIRVNRATFLCLSTRLENRDMFVVGARVELAFEHWRQLPYHVSNSSTSQHLGIGMRSWRSDDGVGSVGMFAATQTC